MQILFATVVFSAAMLTSTPGAADVTPTPSAFVEIADFSNVILSPDGNSVAFRVERGSIETNTYDSEWYVQAVDGYGPPVEVATGGEPIRIEGWSTGERGVWSQDSRWIYFRALHGGDVQVWRARSDGTGVEPVTHDAANVAAFRLIQDQGLIYAVGATRGEVVQAETREYDAGIQVDRSTPIGRALFRSGYIEGRRATERYTGSWMDTAGLLSEKPKRHRFVDLGNLESRDAIPSEAAVFDGGVGAESDLRDRTVAQSYAVGTTATAYLTAGRQQELRVRERGTEITCGAAACANVAWYAWRPGTDEIIFASKERSRGGAYSLHAWNVRRNDVRNILVTDGVLYGGRNFDPNNACAVASEEAVCIAADANMPPRLEKIDLTSGERVAMYEPNAQLESQIGGKVEFISWRDQHGTEFTGQYYPAAPNARGRRPPLFITYYRCGGFVRGGAGDEWPLAALANAGIAALCITYPPQDSSRAPSEGAALEDYRRAESGIRAALDILARRGVDTTRVGMGGFSFGAEVTLWLTMNTDILSTASFATPPLSENFYWQHALMGDHFDATIRRAWGLGSPTETPERWRQLSPGHNVDRIRIPVVFQVPEQEYLASVDVFVQLAMSPVPSEMYVFPDEPHYKFQPRHKAAVYERNLDWLRFWLQGYVDPSPEKAETYDRWRTMQQRWRGGVGEP